MERELHVLELEQTKTKNSIIPVRSGIEEIQLITQQVTKEFQKLPISEEGGWFELLKQMNACFVCFGNYPKQKCPNNKPCSLCGSEKHHVLLCKSEKVKTDPKADFHTHAESASHATQGAGLPLYPIQQPKVCEWKDSHYIL